MKKNFEFVDEYIDKYLYYYFVKNKGEIFSEVLNIENCLYTSANSSKDRDDLLRLVMKTNLGKLYLGDSLKIFKIIPDKSIDLILIDPPYLYPDIAKKLENKEKYIEYNLKKMQDHNCSNIQYQIRKRELEFLQGEFIDSFDIPSYFKEWMRIIKKPNFIIYLSKQQLKEYLIEIENYNLQMMHLVIMHIVKIKNYVYIFIINQFLIVMFEIKICRLFIK
ncbi:hypothetical protein SKUN_00169 [Spiroplasma kunkelii CR2-3x]|uniref:DNA methylase n=1 Tax=Spiroplasma kunkelii CR2-3x TaxID=273035 RepID=A0A0K2JF87_SPIKU|nr:hypothetical protein [Spiroplasma kunkelii]ALA97092.1 hypothetical protein SKUN_00169 [Spiroplasma kunkelii CR2-3x]